MWDSGLSDAVFAFMCWLLWLATNSNRRQVLAAAVIIMQGDDRAAAYAGWVQEQLNDVLAAVSCNHSYWDLRRVWILAVHSFIRGVLSVISCLSQGST